MICPKCASAMETVLHHDVEVDRCSRCKGIWFDELERERLSAFSDAAFIDAGDAKLGATFNKKDRYPCPRCHGAMIRMVDPQQSHIWYEQCGSCEGSFFDAGEFTDLQSHTLLDFFKSLLTPERP